jgi:hypothetical protein
MPLSNGFSINKVIKQHTPRKYNITVKQKEYEIEYDQILKTTN